MRLTYSEKQIKDEYESSSTLDSPPVKHKCTSEEFGPKLSVKGNNRILRTTKSTDSIDRMNSLYGFPEQLQYVFTMESPTLTKDMRVVLEATNPVQLPDNFTMADRKVFCERRTKRRYAIHVYDPKLLKDTLEDYLARKCMYKLELI